MKLSYLLKAIKMVCAAHDSCESCSFCRVDPYPRCLFGDIPQNWNIEEIQKSFDEVYP